MKTENPISEKYLKSIGFRQSFKDVTESGQHYKVMTLKKNDSTLDCTLACDIATGMYFELNGEELQGKQMTVARLQNLIELL